MPKSTQPLLSPLLSSPHLSKGALANERVDLVAVHPPLPWPHLVVVVLVVPVTALAFLLLPT